MAVLVPCPSCSRHVAVSETVCPFCASAVPEDLAARAIPAANRRLSRIAIFTFATSVTAVGAVAGCNEDQGSVTADYGSAACDNSDCTVLDGGIGTLYGLADAQFVDDAAPDASDAAVNDDSGDAGEDAD